MFDINFYMKVHDLEISGDGWREISARIFD